MKSVIALFVLALATDVVGCAATPPPLRVRANDLRALEGAEGVIAERPVIVELFPGDTIPLYVAVEGDLVGTAPGTGTIPVTVKRHFFLRIAKDGIRTSGDGTFADASTTKGQFRFGVGVTKKDGLRGDIAIRTPSYTK